MQCFFLINTFCPKINNPEGSVIVNKIIFDYNYPVNHKLVELENAKKFTNLMLEDVVKATNIQPLVIFTDTDSADNTTIYQFLTLTILKIQLNEINQSVYYVANKVISINIEGLDDENLQFSLQEHSANDLQTMFKQMIKLVGSDNIKEIWAINIGNSLKTKHYIILLHNRSYLCSCLSIIHHKEPFLAADKFSEEVQNQLCCPSIQYLSICSKDKFENNQTILEQKVIYRKLHGIYKKALCKALQKHTKFQQLISLLQDFVNKSNESDLDS
ncbi:23145_t:CDS:2 [Cetraspora pellucida]|uniref:23145_t:CDS:1 n=1 Tax=Cetraspora pellucida TaxID=1433469 RepID=A0A9N9NMK4_9GLOM|nr:23145_t:CDS:2 [Cetraspora pellucida]